MVDTIVVGAGAAGCVLAAHLSAAQDHRVCLVEAGPDPRPLTPDLEDGTRNSMRRYDWGLRHRPTTSQFRLPLPRGRLVGGSSAVNTCVALRGVPEDFNAWAARGLTDWSWEAVLPVYRSLERDLDYAERPDHGAHGPLPIRRHRPSELSTWQAAFLDACADLGHPACPDHNAVGATGAGPTPVNHIDGVRWSAARCWLDAEVRARTNLQICPDTRATHLAWEGTRAVGVHTDQGLIRGARVVLALGAIHTPGLLLRSGVGPPEVLTRLGGAVRVASPSVGARLLDHPGCAIFFRPRHRVDTGVGLLQASLRTTAWDDPRPAGLQVQAGSFWSFPRFAVPAVSIMLHIGRPRGWGTLRWPSLDPRVRPVIDNRFLEDPHDRRTAVEGLKLAYALSQTPAMRDLARPVWPWRRPLEDDARLERWVRSVCDSGYHPCGTVPMGDATDERGKVHGTEGLWVADASLFPEVPSPNIHLPTLMVATRIASWLNA